MVKILLNIIVTVTFVAGPMAACSVYIVMSNVSNSHGLVVIPQIIGATIVASAVGALAMAPFVARFANNQDDD